MRKSQFSNSSSFFPLFHELTVRSCDCARMSCARACAFFFLRNIRSWGRQMSGRLEKVRDSFTESSRCRWHFHIFTPCVSSGRRSNHESVLHTVGAILKLSSTASNPHCGTMLKLVSTTNTYIFRWWYAQSQQQRQGWCFFPTQNCSSSHRVTRGVVRGCVRCQHLTTRGVWEGVCNVNTARKGHLHNRQKKKNGGGTCDHRHGIG